MELYPRVLRADKPNALTISDERLKNDETVFVVVQSMERYNFPHSSLYRIDESDRYKPFPVTVKNGVAKFNFFPLGEQRHRVYIEYGVRPVINLKADVQLTGTGTANDPYVVVGAE